MPNPTATPSIAVLGAGPSGLAFARLLELRGIDYLIYERDVSLDIVGQGGGTLDIHTGSGQEVLKAAGLFEQFQAKARYDGQAMKVVDKDCNVLMDVPFNEDEDISGPNTRPEIDRKDLRKLLLDSVPAEKIVWNSKVDSVGRADDGTVALNFTNGGVTSGFRLVVGADGAWSKARPMISSATPQYSGYAYLQTSISTTNPIYPVACSRCGTGSYMAVGARKSFAAQRLADGSYSLLIGLALPPDWAERESARFRAPDFRVSVADNEFADFHPDITELMRQSDGRFHFWPLYALPPESMSRKSQPGITLIGDAAHLGLPNGKGVNSGLHDAQQLVQEIDKVGLENVDEAIREYECDMLVRGKDHILNGTEMQQMLFAEGPEKFKEWIVQMGMSEGETA